MAKDPFGKIRGVEGLSGVDPSDETSWRWFKSKVGKITSGDKFGFDDVVNSVNIHGHEKDTSGVSRKGIIADDQIGKMFMFRYLPIGRNELPYYDTFPLILTIDLTSRWITGLNLHYLPPKHRQQLFNHLNDFATDDIYDKHTRIRLNYRMLKGFERLRYYKPCFKKYLRKRMRSEMLFVPPADWNIAINLPTEKFRKASKRRVWTDSVNSIK